MEIQCECGKFKAELLAFPKNTPGRLVCYCDDCQTYLHYLNRADLFDANGGTEVVPVYPSELRIVSGQSNLKCTQLSPNGMHRFSTTCCNTPIANIRPSLPWIGLVNSVFSTKDGHGLEAMLGPVRSRIMGKYAKGTPPPGTPKKLNLKALTSVIPFTITGKLLRKSQPSAFFPTDGKTPVVPSQVPSKEELKPARELARKG